MVSNEHSTPTPLEPICNVITPVGMLGYGFDETLTYKALEKLTKSPARSAIILDSGSTDSGPEKLAFGTTSCPLTSYERDLRKLIALANKFNVPVITSSTGGSGSDCNADAIQDVMKKIMDEPSNQYVNISIIFYRALQDANRTDVTASRSLSSNPNYLRLL